MDKYLTVMVTVLVATQVIRITQNTISLIRQNKAIKRDLEWIKDRDITEHDFDCQREVFYLLREKLREEQDADAYQRGYEAGFREGRTRKELIDALDDDLK